jgi:hypothetical protein
MSSAGHTAGARPRSALLRDETLRGRHGHVLIDHGRRTPRISFSLGKSRGKLESMAIPAVTPTTRAIMGYR